MGEFPMLKNLNQIAAIAAISVTASLATSSTTFAKDKLVVAFQGGLNNKPVQCHLRVVAKGISDLTGWKLEFHAGGSAFASPKKLFPQLSRGITDLSVMPLAYTPGRFPLAEIAMLPFVQEDHKALATALNKLSKKYLQKEFKGTRPFGLLALPPYNIHLKKPVKNIVTDLKGMRLRVVGKGLSTAFRALGVDVVGMPITQVYENMQKGVMNGYVLPNVATLIFKLHEVSDYHAQVKISSAVVFLGMSQKAWDSLSAAHQKQISTKFVGHEAAVRYTSCFDKVSKIALKVAKKSKGIIYQPTSDEIAQLKKIAQPATDSYLASVEKKGLPGKVFYNELKSLAAAEAKARMKK
jgi:TRAP-type C4-dicarboxylate transport system substrate-binding protein